MSPKTAFWFSAIGRQRLIALAEERVVRGFQDPDSGPRERIFDGLSINIYRESWVSQAPTVIIHEKALAILKKVQL